MSLSRKISIDKVCGIQEDEKTKRTIILVENEGDEIELSLSLIHISEPTRPY